MDSQLLLREHVDMQIWTMQQSSGVDHGNTTQAVFSDIINLTGVD